jgi:hypothetical protein
MRLTQKLLQERRDRLTLLRDTIDSILCGNCKPKVISTIREEDPSEEEWHTEDTYILEDWKYFILGERDSRSDT